MDFNEVIGQQAAKERLMRMVEENRVPHALLFTGSEGTGKMALAMAFAAGLLTRSTVSPGNAQAMIARWEHPDLHFVYPTVKLPGMSADHQPVSNEFAEEWHRLIAESSYFTMTQWMKAMGATTQQAVITGAESDELSRVLSLKSSQGGYKVCIIWLPERMNLTSANKLLKLLEEPPQETVFLMVSEEPERLLDTIISRTQRIELKPIETEEMAQQLVSRRGLESDTARTVARVAHGSWLRALQTLEAGNENREFLSMFQMLMRHCYMRNVKELKRWSEAVAAYGREKERRLLAYFRQQIRENFMYNFRNPELVYMTQEEEAFARNFARFINEANVAGIDELFAHAHRDIGQNANAKIVLYDMALKLIVLLLRK